MNPFQSRRLGVLCSLGEWTKSSTETAEVVAHEAGPYSESAASFFSGKK